MIRVHSMSFLDYSVVLAVILLGFTKPAQLEQNVTSIENTLDILTHNVSALRKDMVSAEVLNLYLNEEAGFRNDLQQQLHDLAQNVTDLRSHHQRDQLVIQKLENEKDVYLKEVQTLKSTQSNLQQALKQMSLAMVDNEAEIVQMNESIGNELSQLSLSVQQDRNDIVRINKSLTASLEKEVTNLRHQLSGNITSVQSKLARYIESGRCLIILGHHFSTFWNTLFG